ncbi:CDP-diacylglycerol--serine O-phosphatidyltransferase [Pontibacter ummariensis]|uniref:CDP-diacylglycerol---serine O-phosphatidyltransferase n=1 Tax=Pontibacter ummariensis TaxID=1610492 RepID=A0A239HUH1_9BACT|nr:CDP-alcohol phosphatidyltransferase family protein [Pontibacter ummariensis]PRY10442.1 CDP-diacylglycerol--serine O-phosphatidyltransferase [Pontibacter ummariensis]SNS84902.1 CDP-diacylglycerol---serine O-phosphatidyltransferase [Pontibacter ummariensis]
MKKHIPNAITCLNLFSGCLALYFAFQGNLVYTAYLVGIAAVFDFLDGMLARVLKAYCEIGKQLDSLADMVSFGVVPGTVMFILFQRSGVPLFGISAELLPFSGFLITVFSALRLAKFNIDTRQTTSFIGLPTPACTIFVASLPLILEHGSLLHYEVILNPLVLLVLTFLLSYLLVAELPLFALKFSNLSWQDNSLRFIFLGLAVILLALLKFTAIPLVIVLYVLLSVIKKTSHSS